MPAFQIVKKFFVDILFTNSVINIFAVSYLQLSKLFKSCVTFAYICSWSLSIHIPPLFKLKYWCDKLTNGLQLLKNRALKRQRKERIHICTMVLRNWWDLLLVQKHFHIPFHFIKMLSSRFHYFFWSLNMFLVDSLIYIYVFLLKILKRLLDMFYLSDLFLKIV